MLWVSACGALCIRLGLDFHNLQVATAGDHLDRAERVCICLGLRVNPKTFMCTCCNATSIGDELHIILIGSTVHASLDMPTWNSKRGTRDSLQVHMQ